MKQNVQKTLTKLLCVLTLAGLTDVRYVVAAPRSLSSVLSDDQTLQMELLNAAMNGSTERLAELLRIGVSPDAKDQSGSTALYVCADCGNVAGIEKLLEAGADPNIDRNNETPLDIAIINDHTEIVRKLLAAGAKTETFLSENGTTIPISAALAHAAASCNNEIFTLVLESGADVNSCNFHGHRPLLSAAINGYTERVRTLLAKGADINGRSLHNETALHYAAEEGHSETVYFLLEAGADIDARDEEGWTALSSAAFYDRAETVALLLASGAKTELHTSQGETALLLAAANAAATATIKTLVAYGADCAAKDEEGHGALYHLEHNVRLSQSEKSHLTELLKKAGAKR